MSTTKPDTETGWSKRMPHEHVMSTADQELAHALKNEFLELCLSRKASSLVALSAARCAAECFESIINEQGGEVFTVNAPSDFEQLIRLRKAAEAALLALEMATFSELDATGERAKRVLREALGEPK